MNTHADKKQKNKSHSAANAVSGKQGNSESTFQFADNRPEAVVQRKLQEVSNNSPRVKEAAQLQNMITNHFRKQQDIQKKGNRTGLTNNSKGQIIQRAIDVETPSFRKWKKDTETDADYVYRTYFRNNEREQRLCQATGSTPKDIIAILNRYNDDDRGFRSIQHLESSVHSDLFQSFFRAGYHKRRANLPANQGRIPVNSPENSPRMKVYRTMGARELAEIRKWADQQNNIKTDLIVGDPDLEREVNDIEKDLELPRSGSPLPVRNHLGGYDQATTYTNPGREPKFLIEFTLTRQAPRLLQDTNTIALQYPNPRGAIAQIHQWHNTQFERAPADGGGGEGLSPGRIGLKSENRGGEALSIAIGENTETRELFQTMVSKVKIVNSIPAKP
ncbi:hypothetical protein [Flavilitoribacter nigricans]|uniref:Uncharacterized protein n=1 Tax=Flavilitoribacter nigricans (strain ATCC 23147 / DSM 23189 / NBRC 102662 / NCIMB 1420 / SS-2) TaxID=1122177 RepID=A0A2D0N1A1_FLAN2|nr:hypothetical protein [Flavilitoribacter nigricans]PHN02210.1 hypothetical protein CRP01_33285 [Flavilitoribacter nigricans DSM 23189 = NBRC 102662]